ncbi:MAG: MGMT family protein [Terriglobales bacterium]
MKDGNTRTQAKNGMFAKILRQVRRIPRGKVATYGDVAYAAGFPGAARQVVWALHSSSGLPWQRVVGAGGKILLTGEAAMEQRFRLENEGVHFVGLRVDMDECRFAFFARKKISRAKRNKRRSSD